MQTELAGTGQRKRLKIDGEPYYLIVTHGDNGPHVCVTCPRENAPENRRLRAVLETVCEEITETLRRT